MKSKRWFAGAIAVLFLTGFGAIGGGPLKAAEGVPASPQEIRARGEQGEAEAQFRLGEMYEQGQGTTRDYQAAAQWYLKAAQQGHAGAQHAVGTLYGHGWGVPQDFAQAARWCLAAARQGHPTAQSKIGYMYENGMGVPADPAEAAGWYLKAADQGDPIAQLNLGLLFRSGKGLPTDPVQAYMWFDLAGRRSHGQTRSRALRLRATLAARMSPAELERGRKLASQWRPRAQGAREGG